MVEGYRLITLSRSNKHRYAFLDSHYFNLQKNVWTQAKNKRDYPLRTVRWIFWRCFVLVCVCFFFLCALVRARARMMLICVFVLYLCVPERAMSHMKCIKFTSFYFLRQRGWGGVALYLFVSVASPWQPLGTSLCWSTPHGSDYGSGIQPLIDTIETLCMFHSEAKNKTSPPNCIWFY